MSDSTTIGHKCGSGDNHAGAWQFFTGHLRPSTITLAFDLEAYVGPGPQLLSGSTDVLFELTAAVTIEAP